MSEIVARTGMPRFPKTSQNTAGFGRHVGRRRRRGGFSRSRIFGRQRAGGGDARQIAFDVGEKHRHADPREMVGEHLQRHGLAGAGRAGDQPVTIREAGRNSTSLPAGASSAITNGSLMSSSMIRRVPSRCHQQRGELRPLPCFFVLEVDEHVAARAGLARDGVGPALDVVRRVAFVAQPEIRVVGGDAHRRRQLLAVGDAQRQVPRRQPLEHLVVEPRRVTELERRADARRQLVEKRVEQREVLLQVRRQLEQQRAELVAERAGDVAERLRRARRSPSAGCRA